MSPKPASTARRAAQDSPRAAALRSDDESDPGAAGPARRRRAAPADRADRRPRVRHANVEARWSKRARAWHYRARVSALGRVLVGVLRPTQDMAALDAEEMRRDAEGTRRAAVMTVAQAGEMVVDAARRRGVLERTARDDYGTRLRSLVRLVGGETKLEQLTDVEEVKRLALRARESGLTAATVVQKLLPFLSLCFREAGVRDPVPAARRELRQTLKPAAPAMPFFLPAELVDLLARMRDWRPTPAHTDTADSIEADADLVAFVAATGVRAGELGRVRIDDVDLARGRVEIAEPKDRGNPRVAVVGDALRPVLERVVARAEQMAAAGANPLRLIVPGSEVVLYETCRRWRDRLRVRHLSGRALRHSYGTGLLLRGAALNEVMHALGHRRVSTTSKYVHALGQRQASLAADWSAVLANVAEPTVAPEVTSA